MSDINDRTDKLLATLEKGIEERLHEQFQRYRRAGVLTNTRAVIDQVLEQEKEQFLKNRKQWEDDERDALVDFVDFFVRERLPELRDQFYNWSFAFCLLPGHA